MIVIVAGGRYYNDRKLVFAVLDKLNSEKPIDLLIQGGATGADALALEWCNKRYINCVQVDADWKKLGNAAGPIRNRKMLEDFQPDLVVAFPGNRGTADMKRQAKKAGVKVLDCAGLKVREADQKGDAQ
jgi:hypothetical protein